MGENIKNYFFWNESDFKEAVRKCVCSQCEYFDARAVCRIPDERGCALFRYLPQLVMIAQHLKEPDLASYARRVREDVKMECANPNPKAPCRLYDTLDCGLEKFLPLVLEAVEETDHVLERRAGFANGAEALHCCSETERRK